MEIKLTIQEDGHDTILKEFSNEDQAIEYLANRLGDVLILDADEEIEALKAAEEPEVVEETELTDYDFKE